MNALFRAVAAALLVIFTQPAFAENVSPYEQRKTDVDPVSAVVVDGPFKVTIFGDADRAEVVLFGPPELLADAIAEVVDNELVIRFREDAAWSWNPGSGMYATVHLPDLDSVAVKGAGQVEVRGATADNVSLGVGGAGRINASGIEADTLEIGVGGSGTVVVEGQTIKARYGIGGSGSIEAKRVRAQTAEIGIGGPGRVFADVSDSARIGVSGAGRVEVVGGAKCEFAPTQEDQIECR